MSLKPTLQSFVAALCLLFAVNAHATHFYVTTNGAAYGPGEFSYEINQMNADNSATPSNPHIVDICVGGYFYFVPPLQSCILNFPKDMTAYTNSVYAFNPVSTNEHMTINNLVFQGCGGYGSFYQGYGSNYSFTFNNCIFRNNKITYGNLITINSADTVNFNNCSFYNNRDTITNDNGGTIMSITYNSSQINATNCTFSKNSSANTNTSATRGGGVFRSLGYSELNLVNCTFYGNSSASAGGAIEGPANITNCIFVGNTAPTGPNLNGTYGSIGGHNYFSDTSGALIGGNTVGDNFSASTNATIDTVLSVNSKFLYTHSLIAGSLAINGGADTTGVPHTDARGFARNGLPDAGAYEYNGVNNCSGFSIHINPVSGCAPSSHKISYTLTGGVRPISSHWYVAGGGFYCTDTLVYTGGGTFTATVSDSNGCVAVDSITLIYHTTPVSQTKYLCNANDSIVIGDSVYHLPGTYVNYIGCDTTLTTNVLQVNNQLSSYLSTNSINWNCSTRNGVFNPTIYLNGGNANEVTYLWSNGATTSSIALNTVSSSNLIAIVTDTVTGCKVYDTVTQTVDTIAPTVSITTNQSWVGCTKFPTLTAHSTAGFYYSWQNGVSGTDSITTIAGSSGAFGVTVTNPTNNCYVSPSINLVDSTQVNVVFAPASPTLTCRDTVLNVVASGATYYAWSNGDTTARTQIRTTGNFNVSVTDTITGCSGNANVNVNQDLSTNITIAATYDTVNCQHLSTTISTNGLPPYTWNIGDTTATITVSPTSNSGYYVFASDSTTGCRGNSNSVVIRAVNVPPTVNHSVLICPGSSLTVGTHTYNTAGTYTDQFACDSIVKTTITIDTVYRPTLTLSAAPFIDLTKPFVSPASTNDTYEPDNAAQYAFDGDTTTYGWGTNGGLNNELLQYDYGVGNAVVLTSYSMYLSRNQNGGWSGSSYSPSSWTFQATNDSVWTTLDSIVNDTVYNGVLRTFNFTNTKAYQKYRINITACAGSGNEPHITELYLAGATIHKAMSASSIYSFDDKPEYAFDNDTTNTGWVSDSLTAWLAYNFGTPTAINGYSIYISPNQDGSGYWDDSNNPNAWHFQGTNNDTVWVGLDSVTSANLVSGTKRFFTLSNPATYKKYRIFVDSTNGSRRARITEMELLQNLPVCNNLSFTASITNGGSNPAFQWKVNGVATGDSSNPQTFASLHRGDSVTVILTPNNHCQTANTLSATTKYIGNSVDSFTQTVCKDSLVLHGVPVTTSGIYVDSLTSVHGCDSILVLNLTVINCHVDVQNITDNVSITLYPNPANDVLNISCTERLQLVEVYNMLGEVVLKHTGDTQQLAVNNLAAGVYTIRMQTVNGKTAVNKFCKQ